MTACFLDYNNKNTVFFYGTQVDIIRAFKKNLCAMEKILRDLFLLFLFMCMGMSVPEYLKRPEESFGFHGPGEGC